MINNGFVCQVGDSLNLLSFLSVWMYGYTYDFLMNNDNS